jgi:hypothetical protein
MMKKLFFIYAIIPLHCCTFGIYIDCTSGTVTVINGHKIVNS